MKKTVSLLLLILLLTGLLPGCGEDGGETDLSNAATTYTAAQLAAALLDSQDDLPEMYDIAMNDAEFASYAAIYLGEELAERVVDGVICYPFGPLATEAAVFEFAHSDDTAQALEPMGAYIEARVSAFYGYAPEEAELAEGGQAQALGSFAVLYILSGPASAKRALERAFSDDPPEPPELSDLVSPLHEVDATPNDKTEVDGGRTPDEEQPPEVSADDEYDHDAVLAALRSGSSDGLTPKNLAVFEAVTEIFEEIITPDMTDYEKELAVNDYLVFHAEYDPAELESGPVGAPDPDNDNPYGLLVHGVGICLGYTTTFQLMMDALDIECVTVHGFARGWEEEHAWNLVRLEGDWYAVDVTWNDPVFTDWTPDVSTRLYYAHTYFNVTSDHLRATEHYWSEDAPEAQGSKYAYAG